MRQIPLMTPVPITIHTGVAWLDEEYFDIEVDGVALDLTDYDIQMQILDADDDNSLIVQPSVNKDSGVTGRAWPSLTAAQTLLVYDKQAIWMLFLRLSDLSQEPRLIAMGRVDVKVGSTWV